MSRAGLGVRRGLVLGAALGAAWAGVAAGQPYVFTVSNTGNTFSGTVNVNAPYSGSLVGQYLTVVNGVTLPAGEQTRTVPGSFGGVTAAPNNQVISPIIGAVTSTGSPSTRPTGQYILKWTPATRRVDLYTMDVNVIGTSAAPTLPVNVVVTSMPAFRSRDPNYSYPAIPNILVPSLSVPLGNATLTVFRVTNTAAAFATATVGTGGAFNFTMDVPAVFDSEVTLNGQVIPTSVPLVVTVNGTITPTSPTAATATMSFTANVNQPVPVTPADPPPTPFPVDLPNPLTFAPPNAHVLFTLFFTAGGVNAVSGTTNLPGAGVTPRSLADVAAIGGAPGADGQLTVDDIIAFVNAFGDGQLLADVTGIGGPPELPDGQLTVDDIIAFVNAFGEG